MAVAITYTDGTIREVDAGEIKLVYWQSAADVMNSADYVDVPTITGKTVRILSAWDHSTGDAITATVSGQRVTFDAAGGGTTSTYAMWFFYI